MSPWLGLTPSTPTLEAMVKPYSLVAGQLVSCGQGRETPAEFGKLCEEAARDQNNGRPDNVTHRSKGSAVVESKCGRRLNDAPDLIPLRELNSRPPFSTTAPADHDVTVPQTADPEVPANRPLPLPDLISHLSAKEVTPSRRRKKFRLHFPQVKKTFYYSIVNYTCSYRGIFAFYSKLFIILFYFIEPIRRGVQRPRSKMDAASKCCSLQQVDGRREAGQNYSRQIAFQSAVYWSDSHCCVPEQLGRERRQWKKKNSRRGAFYCDAAVSHKNPRWDCHFCLCKGNLQLDQIKYYALCYSYDLSLWFTPTYLYFSRIVFLHIG